MISHKISVYIPVLNEEARIREALESVAWVDDILLVDTGSTDKTEEIAREYTNHITHIVFNGFGDLRNQSVMLCTHPWIFSLDADERCTPSLKDEICRIVHASHAKDAYFIPRRNYFMGRWIKHGGWYPDYCQPKLFRKGALTYHHDMVHEGFDIHGRTGYLKNDVLHYSFPDLSQLVIKMDRYSTLGMKKMADHGKQVGMISGLLHAMAAFFRIYILKLGFLDGWPGFVIALNSAEGTFYRYAKLVEYHREQNRC